MAAQAAVLKGERDVSPRDVAERIMALRIEICRELLSDCGTAKIEEANREVMRRALNLTLSAHPPLED